ncbi:MAG: phenylacetate-CoA oxygenase/reductase subunit PaaK [Chitinophagaceae bacterium]|nr:phenylacetate-CoA oxygenase/reductase subunit PaaK [Chitinophagaceae bacterium]
MSLHFHTLRVAELIRETSDTVVVGFDIPKALQDSFAFTQGQNLTLKKVLNGEELRRNYSLCSAPFENKWRVAIKKVEGGAFSTYANTSLKVGDELEVMTPSGRFFTKLDPLQSKHYVLVAAGSGITPILSILKSILHIEPSSTVSLLYGNKTRMDIIFFEELESIKNKYLDRFQLIHLLSREQTDNTLQFGRIDTNKLNQLEKLVDLEKADEFFICGPEQMIFCVRDFLNSKNVSEKKIHFELFNSSSPVKTKANAETIASTVSKTKLTVTVDGRTLQFEVPANQSTSLLDAALSKGADLPYACKGGMCCTCKAKLKSGTVSMEVSWGLEEDEIKAGYILTCQSIPTSPEVSIDFDDK